MNLVMKKIIFENEHKFQIFYFMPNYCNEHVYLIYSFKFYHMSKNFRYILIGFGILLLGFFLWYFITIVAYIIVASILALIGVPLVDFLGRFHIRNRRIPISLRSLITLCLLWVVFIGFFRIFIPIVAREAGQLSRIDVDSVMIMLQDPIHEAELIYNKFMLGNDEISFQDAIKSTIKSVLDVTFLTRFFGSVAGILGNIFIALFSISFITYFFLKERNILTEAIVILVYKRHEKAVRHALRSTRHLLTRYFIGIGGQLTEIFILVTAGMNIVGLSFKQSLLIGLTAGILNIIPYLGPLIGSSLGIVMGVAFHANISVETIIPMMIYMIIVFIVVHLIDNFLYQPFIFSSTVYAHPLEIFLIILMAGSLAGVPGMILAIPVYTILRVFGKEFFNNFRVVEKLTEKIED